MALRKCKQCGGQVDSSATSCPHCGARKTSWVLVVLFVIMLISIFKSNFDNFKSPSSRQPEQPVVDVKPVVPVPADMVPAPVPVPAPKVAPKKKSNPTVNENEQPEKWYIVYDYKKRICAEIPAPKDGLNVHPESLKKSLIKCSNSTYTNTNGKFWSFNCPEQGTVGTSLYTSTKTFCETLVHLE